MGSKEWGRVVERLRHVRNELRTVCDEVYSARADSLPVGWDCWQSVTMALNKVYDAAAQAESAVMQMIVKEVENLKDGGTEQQDA